MFTFTQKKEFHATIANLIVKLIKVDCFLLKTRGLKHCQVTIYNCLRFFLCLFFKRRSCNFFLLMYMVSIFCQKSFNKTQILFPFSFPFPFPPFLFFPFLFLFWIFCWLLKINCFILLVLIHVLNTSYRVLTAKQLQMFTSFIVQSQRFYMNALIFL